VGQLVQRAGQGVAANLPGPVRDEEQPAGPKQKDGRHHQKAGEDDINDWGEEKMRRNKLISPPTQYSRSDKYVFLDLKKMNVQYPCEF
jgi:hypothetical protein